MAFININYSGGNIYEKDSDKIIGNDFVYENVELHSENEKFIFDSGNLVKDWFLAKRKYWNELADTDPYLSASSNVNHFQGDGGKFDSAYMHIENRQIVLKYIDKSAPHYLFYQRDIYENGWEFFVPEGTQPTWEELKEMCK
jgi:hypothetical protein